MAVSRENGRPRSRMLLAGAAASTALMLAACGSTTHFADNPRPAVPVDLSVYVDNGHVAIAPAKVGAGPVILYVTNQASGNVAVKIETADGGSIASTGTINSGQTAQLTADLRRGTYQLATGTKIRPAKLQITKPRPNADNVLLQP